jgi:flagellar biosynthesis protein FliP
MQVSCVLKSEFECKNEQNMSLTASPMKSSLIGLALTVFLSVGMSMSAMAQSSASKAQAETEKKQAALKKEEAKAQEAGLKAHMKSQDKETRKRMKENKRKVDKVNKAKSWKQKSRNNRGK